MSDVPISLDEALALAREIGDSLGGRQQRALVVLSRYAERGRRLSSTALRSVGHVAEGAQHFVKAQEELAAGMIAIQQSTRTIASVAGEEDPANHKKDP
jgi:hypothetical protein